MNQKEKILISFSGGRTSAYMTYWMLNEWVERDKYDMVVVFANTGKEREETLEFIRLCDLHFGFNTVWIEVTINPVFGKGCDFKIVDFEKCSRNGEPFEEVIAKHGIPNSNFPHCSRELKKYPIQKYINSLGWKDYSIALGIRIDEPKRTAPKPKIIYPFATINPVTKLMVNRWWLKQPFDLNLKGYEGNCDLCWKKSKRKLLTILHEQPSIVNWWNNIEIKYGNYIPDSHRHNSKIKLPLTFFRSNESAQDYLEDSLRPFTKASDDFTMDQLMFSEPELDFTNGCEESCEAF